MVGQYAPIVSGTPNGTPLSGAACKAVGGGLKARKLFPIASLTLVENFPSETLHYTPVRQKVCLPETGKRSGQQAYLAIGCAAADRRNEIGIRKGKEGSNGYGISPSRPLKLAV